MNKFMDNNPQAALATLFTLTIVVAVVGIAFEIVFVINHLGSFAQELSLLTIGKYPN